MRQSEIGIGGYFGRTPADRERINLVVDHRIAEHINETLLGVRCLVDNDIGPRGEPARLLHVERGLVGTGSAGATIDLNLGDPVRLDRQPDRRPVPIGVGLIEGRQGGDADSAALPADPGLVEGIHLIEIGHVTHGEAAGHSGGGSIGGQHDWNSRAGFKGGRRLHLGVIDGLAAEARNGDNRSGDCRRHLRERHRRMVTLAGLGEFVDGDAEVAVEGVDRRGSFQQKPVRPDIRHLDARRLQALDHLLNLIRARRIAGRELVHRQELVKLRAAGRDRAVDEGF